MSAGHSHSAGPNRTGSKRALKVALALTASFMVAEVVGGLISGSLALLADAAHMLSDAGSLGIALIAIWLAEKPPTPRRSFGFQRAEILAALLNGVTLVVASLWIFYEAYRRLEDPPEVLGATMLVVAVLGLAVNLAAAYILSRGGDESLNVSAALRHVLADLAGSVGVIVAATVILLTGWRAVDPIVGALIGLLVLVSAWPVLRDSIRILLEAAPKGLDVEALGTDIAATPGVRQVHDLHVWTITSGFPALAAHVLVGQDVDCHEKRREIETLLAERHNLDHTTLQVDHESPRLLQIESNDSEAEATFVFADLSGFTALTAAQGDEHAIEVVEDFFRHADSLLRRFGGERVKTIGDEVMLRVPDAGAAIQLATELVNHEMAKPQHPAVRAGLHFGPAIRRGGDWFGGAVNIAARIADLAEDGEVLLSEATRDAAGELPAITFEERGRHELHNLPEPVEILAASCHDGHG